MVFGQKSEVFKKWAKTVAPVLKDKLKQLPGGYVIAIKGQMSQYIPANVKKTTGMSPVEYLQHIENLTYNIAKSAHIHLKNHGLNSPYLIPIGTSMHDNEPWSSTRSGVTLKAISGD